jgi:hypothetical protein
MLTLILLTGLWSTTCIQTQVTGKDGFVVDSYEFSEAGDFVFNRHWFSDQKCKNEVSVDQELGTVKIGNEISSIFNQNTYEAHFKTLAGSDFGVISLRDNKLKVGRGFLNTQMRNTMTGIFEYTKL